MTNKKNYPLLYVLMLLPLLMNAKSIFITDTIVPIKLDQEVLSGIGLKQIELKDQPGRAFFQKNLFRGKDLSIYVVSSQSWLGRMDNFPIDEYIFMYNGKARVKPDNGEDHIFHSGEHFFAPKGYTGEWEIMAGENYHYELSVISTPRAPEVIRSKDLIPHAFDKDLLSGVGLDLEDNEKVEKELIRGDELRIVLAMEQSGVSTKVNQPADKIISVLSGQLIVQNNDKEIHNFFTGEVLILPKGFVGTIKTKGHSVVKYLYIERAF